MTRYRNTGTFIIPAARRAAANAALERNGYGPDNFSIPLENPAGVVTHYAAHGSLDNVMLGIFQQAMGPQGEFHRAKGLRTVMTEKRLHRKQ